MSKTDICEIARLSSKFSEHYLRIVGRDGSFFHGGNQNWWQDKVVVCRKNKIKTMKEDEYFRLWQIGCGVIAMSDAELYVMLQSNGGSQRIPVMIDRDILQTGMCRMNAYRDYVEQMYGTKYRIAGNLLNLLAGLYPWTMAKGFHNFLKDGNYSLTKVKWSRYGSLFGVAKKQKVLNEIERMLNDDIPVVFSYYSFKGDKINLYGSIQAAGERNEENVDRVNSHYMTIIGLYGYPAGKSGNYRYILKVVSWGKIYYIDYDEYAEKLDYASNILSVY